MHTQKIHPRNIAVTAGILVVAAVRISLNISGKLHPLTSFSPLGAMALFSGAYFSRPYFSLLVPLVTLFISDAILALTVYGQTSHGILYGGWYWVYGAFACMALAGRVLLRRVSIAALCLATLVITSLHWVISDIGVWLHSSIYARTWAGWWRCLAAAIPFERNFLLGTLFYGMIMFGGFAWWAKSRPAVRQGLA